MLPKIEHSKRFFSGRVLSMIIAAIAIIGALAGLLAVHPAVAASKPIHDVRIVTHFDITQGQQPENILVEPDGNADVTFGFAHQVARVARDGKMHILATLPVPANGGSAPVFGGTFMGGIVRTDDGTLYFVYATGTSDLTGIWRLRPYAHARPERLVAFPGNSLINGLAIDQQTGMLYTADLSLGVVWRTSIRGQAATVWASGSELAPTGFVGADGIKVHNGAVWVTNFDAGTVVRIPIQRSGEAGKTEVKATGLSGIDDFAFTGPGDTILAALNPANKVALVQPDGTHTIVLTAADGLSNPTAVAVQCKTVYVTNAAYLTKADPNLLLAHLS
jgi:sugar lactone lactonase YvrE